MKTYILTLILTFSLSLSEAFATTPGNEVPEVVNRSLTSKYSGAEVNSWKIEDNICVVNFSLGKDDYEAAFDRDGTWVRTGKIIRMSALPATVSKAFNASEYSSWGVDKIAEVEFSGFGDMLMYEVKVENASNNYSLFYNIDGEVVMKTHNMQLRVAKN